MAECFVTLVSLYRAIINTACSHKYTLLTFHSEVEPLCCHPSLVYSDALIPAGLIWGHRGQLKREVGQDVSTWVQMSVTTSSQPCEIEVDCAADAAGEDSTGAWRHSHVALDCDGRRWLCKMKAECCWQPPGIGILNKWLLPCTF